MADVRILKLVSGEDIIGDIKEVDVEGKEFILVNKPMLVVMMPKQENPNEYAVGLVPYAPFAEGNQVPIMPQHIVSIYSPEAGLRNEYSTRFGSGLVVPDNKLDTKKLLKG